MNDAMKIELHNVNIKEFIEVLDTCKGDVFLETDEGDCLNLRSKLCQYTGLTQLLQGGIIANATLRCENIEDEQRLFRFNLFKK